MYFSSKTLKETVRAGFSVLTTNVLCQICLLMDIPVAIVPKDCTLMVSGSSVPTM
jgi:hypothetical protein